MDLLDQLLIELDRDNDQDDELQIESEAVDPDPREDNVQQDITSVIVTSPPVSPRLNPVQIYRRSSSARRVLNFKDKHCFYCNTDVERASLEAHLRSSNSCLTKYQRRLNVKLIDSILVLSYPCLFCDTKTVKLKDHLERSSACLDQFKERWNIDRLR